MTDCRMCAHSYHEDTWRDFETPELKAVQVYCGIVREGQWPHVASFMGTVERPIPGCKRFEAREGEARVWPPRTDRMRKEGRFWTDEEPEPEPRKPAGGQKALEDFA